jgi:hypothetical protein
VQQGRHQQEPTFVLETACVPAIVQKESPSFPRKRWPQAKVGEEVNGAKPASLFGFAKVKRAPSNKII